MEYISTKEYADLHGLKDKSGGFCLRLFFLMPLLAYTKRISNGLLSQQPVLHRSVP